MIRFTVIGHPQTAGSKRAMPRKGGGFPIVIDDNPKSRVWKQEVASKAAEAMMNQRDPDRPGDPAPELFTGALSLDLRFYLARPKGHFGTGRNAGVLKASAPRYHTVKPDATKLTRAIEDALTGVMWRDDAQVSSQVIAKLYGTPERVEICVYELAGLEFEI